MNKKYLELIRLGRPQNTRFPVVLIATFCLLRHQDLKTFLLLAVAYIACYQVITALNNIYDKQTDKKNKLKVNPLVSGVLTRSDVEYYIICSALISIFCLLRLGNVNLALLLALSALVGAWYSLPGGLSYRHYFGTAVLAFWYGALPILMVGAYSHSQFAVDAVAFGLLFTPWLLTKDYRDIVGDAAAGKVTPLLRYGQKHIVATSATLWLIASGLLVYLTRTILIIPALVSYWLLVRQQHAGRIQAMRMYTFLSLICVLVVFYFANL